MGIPTAVFDFLVCLRAGGRGLVQRNSVWYNELSVVFPGSPDEIWKYGALSFQCRSPTAIIFKDHFYSEGTLRVKIWTR